MLLKLSFSITKDARRAETVTERKSFCDGHTLFQNCSFAELPKYPEWFGTVTQNDFQAILFFLGGIL